MIKSLIGVSPGYGMDHQIFWIRSMLLGDVNFSYQIISVLYRLISELMDFIPSTGILSNPTLPSIFEGRVGIVGRGGWPSSNKLISSFINLFLFLFYAKIYVQKVPIIGGGIFQLSVCSTTRPLYLDGFRVKYQMVKGKLIGAARGQKTLIFWFSVWWSVRPSWNRNEMTGRGWLLQYSGCDKSLWFPSFFGEVFYWTRLIFLGEDHTGASRRY